MGVDAKMNLFETYKSLLAESISTIRGVSLFLSIKSKTLSKVIKYSSSLRRRKTVDELKMIKAGLLTLLQVNPFGRTN